MEWCHDSDCRVPALLLNMRAAASFPSAQEASRSGYAIYLYSYFSALRPYNRKRNHGSARAASPGSDPPKTDFGCFKTQVIFSWRWYMFPDIFCCERAEIDKQIVQRLMRGEAVHLMGSILVLLHFVPYFSHLPPWISLSVPGSSRRLLVLPSFLVE